MDTIKYFKDALSVAGGCMQHISKIQLASPTPCSEWDLKALLNHMIGELLWLNELLGGKTIAQVGSSLEGDLVGNDLMHSWQSANKKANQAVNKVNLKSKIRLSYGMVNAEHYIKELSSDLLIHGWDVAQSIKCSLIIPTDLAQFAFDFYKPQENKLKASGLFGTKVPVDNNASLQTKLLAIVGRHAES